MINTVFGVKVRMSGLAYV